MEATNTSAPSSIMNVPSTRSRASSVISTGTKTSIGTLGTFLGTNLAMTAVTSNEPALTTRTTGNSIDVLLGRRNFRISTRPGSVLSISSFDYPAPPYHEAIKTPAVLPNLDDSLQHTLSGHATLATGQNSSSTEDNSDFSVTRLSDSDTAVSSNVTGDSDYQDTVHARLTEENNSNNDDVHSVRSVNSTAISTQASTPFSPLYSESAQNAISRYYTEIVRQIDSNHQTIMAQEQASHEAHLAAMRTELEVAHETSLDDLRSSLDQQHQVSLSQLRNDIDSTYRIQFKQMQAQAFDLEEKQKKLSDDLKASSLLATHFEKESKKLEAELGVLREELVVAKLSAEERELRARNQVEDVWEARWRQRMDIAADQILKAERESSKWADQVEERWGKEVMREINRIVREKIDAEHQERETRQRSATKGEPIAVSSPAEKSKKKIWPSFSNQKSDL